MARTQSLPFDPQTFLTKVGSGKTSLTCPQETHDLFARGCSGGRVLYPGGQGQADRGLEAGQRSRRRGTGTWVLFWGILPRRTDGSFGDRDRPGRLQLVRIDKDAMIRMLHEEPTFAELFIAYLLAHTLRVEADLVDQLFNSSEKRLARVLLLMAHFGKEGKAETVMAKISQETLAEMIGTTRSRVSFFMNKFRKLGFIDYNGALHVHSSLLNVVLHD